MWARVARYEVEPERMEAAVEGFEAAASGLSGLSGTRGGFLLVDREEGSVLTVTFWESWDALRSSDVAATVLRRQAMEEAQGQVASVAIYEVAAEFGNGAQPV
jgi:heme-degrading monooxygenase HmoA